VSVRLMPTMVILACYLSCPESAKHVYEILTVAKQSEPKDKDQEQPTVRKLKLKLQVVYRYRETESKKAS